MSCIIYCNNEWHLTLLNRGNRKADIPKGVDVINVDINDEAAAAKVLEDKRFDTVCDFIGFVPGQLERDYRLFKGKVKQFMYISSASAYNKLPADYRITEGTALANPYWEYSRNKIACEDFLMKMYREEGFPVTIIRPSHTYDERSIPMGVHGSKGSFQVIKRMLEGKPVIVHGDGTSLWTMTFNEDFAKGFIGLMGNPHAIGYIRAVQDRVALEIQRGCIRGCRFCQAGMIYRPLRERSLEFLEKYALAMINSTGYEEITLCSLSSSDYTKLAELMDFLINEMGKRRINISLPSLRIDAFSLDVMSRVQDVRKSSITFAPEAGTQRMRDIINKGLDEETTTTIKLP